VNFIDLGKYKSVNCVLDQTIRLVRRSLHTIAKTASTSAILAIDLGKYKSVNWDAPAKLRQRSFAGASGL
jgi:hypothetical protein